MKRDSNRLIRRRSGFTLMELMVVMFIIGLLATIAIPTVSEYLRVAKHGASLTVLGQIQGACDMYEADFGEFPPSALDGVYADWQGGELLALFLTGYGPDLPLPDGDGIPGDDMVTDDGHQGFGFRVERRGRIFPPYNGTEKKDMGRANGRPYFVDAWGNPICYYRFDVETRMFGSDSEGPPAAGGYMRDPSGKFYREDVALCTKGFNRKWDPPSGSSDDVTNFQFK